MKKYTFLDMETKNTIDFNSKTPREAALKAASRDIKFIVIIEDDKMHLFSGAKCMLTEKQMNDFTSKNNIQSKPKVHKLGYKRLSRVVDVKKDFDFIQSELDEFTG